MVYTYHAFLNATVQCSSMRVGASLFLFTLPLSTVLNVATGPVLATSVDNAVEMGRIGRDTGNPDGTSALYCPVPM